MKTKKVTRSGAIRTRYSNLVPTNYNFGGSWNSYGGNSGLLFDSTGTSSLTEDTGSGWSSQDTVNLATAGISSLESILNSIFGHNNQWQAQALNTMYNQEKRTNTILWVVIGLILALGVVLVIRKTK